MSALLTHVALGVLLALALRLRLRDLPIAAFLAAAPDLDHLGLYLPVPFLQARVTFTNVFVCVLLPVGVLAWMHARGASAPQLRVAVAAPLLLASHLLLDLMPIDGSGGLGRVALFWPLSDAWYGLPSVAITRIDPRQFSTLTIVLTLLTLGVLATELAARGLERSAGKSSRANGVRVGAVALAWILVFPTFLAAGLLAPSPRHAEAAFEVVDARVDKANGVLEATIVSRGGESVAAGALMLEALANGAPVASATNPAPLAAGESWRASLPLPPASAKSSRVDVRLSANSILDPFRYAALSASAEASDLPHVRVASVEAPPLGGGAISLENVGKDVGEGSVRVRVTRPDGALLADAASPFLPAGATWTIPLARDVSPLTAVTIDVRTTSGTALVRESWPLR